MSRKFWAALVALYALILFPLAANASAVGGIFELPSFVPTYSASSGYFTAASSPTDIAQITGSSTKTIKILKIFVNYEGGTADVQDMFVVKRSTADTGGTLTSMTPIPLSSTLPAASAGTVCNYTANPTLGSSVGIVDTSSVLAVNPGGAGNGTPRLPIFDCDKYGGALELHGTSEAVCVNEGGHTLTSTSPKIQVTFVWTEQ